MSLDAMAVRISQREAGVTAAGGGQSWRWQLRDKNGQWIEMGAKVKWFANGLARHGVVIGSPKEGEAEVEESETKRHLRIAARRLAVIANTAGEKVRTLKRDEKGSVTIPAKQGSQPEPDTVAAPKGTIASDTELDLPPAKPNGSSDEPRPGANSLMKKFFGRSRNPDGSRRHGRTVEQGAKGTEDDPIYVGNDVNQAVELLVQGKSIRMSESPTVAMVVQKLGPALEQAEKDIKAKYNIPKDKTALDFPEGSPERKALESLGLNMCAIQVPGTNIFCVKHKGIPRISMPQLSGKDKETGKEKNVQPWAEEMLDSMKLIGPVKSIKADTVTASQSELGAIQIAQMLDSYRNWKAERDRIAAMPDGPDKTAAAAELERRSNPKTKDPKDFTYMSENVLTAPILVSKDGYIIDGHHRWAVLIASDLEDGGLGDVDMNVREVDMEVGEALATVNAFADAAGIARKAPKGAAAPKEVPVPEILKDAKVRAEITQYILDNMEKIKAKVDAGSTEGILASAVQEGDVLLRLRADHLTACQVLRVAAETSGGRSFVQQDVHSGDLSLAILSSGDLVTIL